MNDDICSVDSCGNKTLHRGWCSKHYTRWRRHGDPLFTLRKRVDLPERPPAICSVKGCTSLKRSHGLCSKHVKRLVKSGDPLSVTNIVGDDLARFHSKIQILNNGCWQWIGYITPNGYADFGTQTGTRAAHRWYWQRLNGPVPTGLHLDHYRFPELGCIGRACVNPEHVRPVTARENIVRGDGPTAWNLAKTHCPQEHEYTPENTYESARGGRRCKKCCSDQAHVRYLNRKNSQRGAADGAGHGGANLPV